MLFVTAWIVFPALLLLVTLGCGLAVERASSARLPGELLVPVGLAAVVVVARAAVASGATAELAPVAVLALALLGFGAGRARLRRPHVDRWTAAGALAVFGVFAAPVVLGGSASFAGYTVLGDTAVHFVLVDRIMSDGTGIAGLLPSSYRETLTAYFGSGYPLGAHAALGAVRELVGIDIAWTFQPFLAFMAAALALALAGLLRGVVESPVRRALVATLAAQPALVYSYALQGSIKELATAWLIPLIVALVPLLRRADGAPLAARGLIPLAVVSAAAIAVIGVAAATWLGPILLVVFWLVWREPRLGLAPVARLAGVFALALGLLSLPTLLDLDDYLDVTREVVTSQAELGNLFAPLPRLHAFGIWLQGDYRIPPDSEAGIDELELTYMLIGVAAISAVVGGLWLLRRRGLAPLLFIATSLIALWYVTRTGSPWADAKALAIAAPAFLLAAGLGPLALERMGARVEALVLAGLLAAGVVVSNAFAYHDASLAPRERLSELADVGERTAGRGPLLYTEFEEMAKHFLRDSQPVGASEGIFVPGLSPLTRAGDRPSFGAPADPASLRLKDLQRFRSVVLRRSPLTAALPVDHELAWRGSYYELWVRDGPHAIARAALDGDGGRADCRRLRRLAAPARPRGARLRAVRFPTIAELRIADAPLPPTWARRADDPTLVHTVGPGRVEGELEVARSGDYEVWIRGSFGREVAVLVDGRRAGAVRDELAQPAAWVQVGDLRLTAGKHDVAVVRADGSAAPGNGDGPRSLGSVVLRRRESSPASLSVPKAEWRRLCRHRLASVDVVAAGPAAS